jgi:hypothetical protein
MFACRLYSGREGCCGEKDLNSLWLEALSKDASLSLTSHRRRRAPGGPALEELCGIVLKASAPVPLIGLVCLGSVCS